MTLRDASRNNAALILGGTLSGHTIKHLLAGAGVFAIVRQLRLRSALAARDTASH